MMIYPSKKDIHFPVAKLIEFRTVIRDVDGKSKSVPIGKASIPADEKLVLKTGGNHLFLGGLRQTLEVGKTLFMHIQVRHLNGPLEIEVPISYKEPK
jgi:copper(I)-binding protein